jgi:peptidoglycan/LPS O-acetylase OafA/YrhL
LNTLDIKLPPGRLVSIDALRGIASFAVVLYHAFAMGVFSVVTPNVYVVWEYIYALPISFGYTGVYLFFVISGFCIHLRWAKAKARNEESFKLDFVSFWKRRIVRLYPAYLVTLALCILIQYFRGELVISTFFVWDIVSHVLMIHNFDPRTVYSINGVLWTLAIEEQLYLAYFLLVYLREKFGWKYTMLFCVSARIGWFALAFALNKSFGYQLPVIESSMANWCIWALGAVSIEAALGIIKLPKWTSSISIGILFLIVAGAIEYTDLRLGRTGLFNKFTWLVYQPIWGFGFFILLNRIVNSEITWFKEKATNYANKGNLIRVFAFVGVFSYSLYLTHEIILGTIRVPAAIGVFICLVFSYFFFLIFEKPFIKTKNAS